MQPVTPMKAIRLKCLDCCNGSSNEVRMCNIKECPLYRYRFGHRPKMELEGTKSDLIIVDEEIFNDDNIE